MSGEGKRLGPGNNARCACLALILSGRTTPGVPEETRIQPSGEEWLVLGRCQNGQGPNEAAPGRPVMILERAVSGEWG